MKRSLLLLFLLVGLAACGSPAVSATAQPSPTPGGPHRLGQVVAVPGWQITLVSARRATKIGLMSPAQSSDTFLLVQVTLRNTSGAPATASDTPFFCLGADSTKYALIDAGTSSIDGSVAAGHAASGQVTYEVPASAHQFTIDYESDAGTVLAAWQFSA